MTMKQRDLLEGLKHQAQALESQLFHLRHHIRTLEDILAAESTLDREDFTDEEIDRLSRLNQCLATLEYQLVALGESEGARLDARLTDPDDRLSDFQIDAKLRVILREDDPAFNCNEFNCLTQRTVSLKYLGWTRLGDGKDHRKAGEAFPGRLAEVPHCWLFSWLRDSNQGFKGPALTLQDCLQAGAIRVDVAVRHIYAMDLGTGDWLPPTETALKDVDFRRALNEAHEGGCPR